MADHTFEWTLEVLGVEFDVTVEYVLESHGEPDNYWTGGGSGPEFYINEVLDQWGNNITEWCSENHDYTKLAPHWRGGWFLGWHDNTQDSPHVRKDLIEQVMFGRTHRKFINPYITYEDILRDAILEHSINDAIDSECEDAYCRPYE